MWNLLNPVQQSHEQRKAQIPLYRLHRDVSDKPVTSPEIGEVGVMEFGLKTADDDVSDVRPWRVSRVLSKRKHVVGTANAVAASGPETGDSTVTLNPIINHFVSRCGAERRGQNALNTTRRTLNRTVGWLMTSGRHHLNRLQFVGNSYSQHLNVKQFNTQHWCLTTRCFYSVSWAVEMASIRPATTLLPIKLELENTRYVLTTRSLLGLYIRYRIRQLVHYHSPGGANVTQTQQNIRSDMHISASVYRCLHGQAPRFLADHLITSSEVASRLRLRSANQHQLIVPRCRLNTYCRRAFSIAGPTVWNSLPDELRDPACGSDSFKQFLKTILFSLH